ncbi:MAG TPA: hypothetical protein DIW23_00160 [Anaerolineae bacterium]|nr:hypothetical protein [Anaerolineae bacterium]
MRKKSKTSWRYIIIVVLFIVLISYYRAFIDDVSFLVALDKILNGLTNSIWILLQNSIVLIAVSVGIGFWILKDSFPKILMAITELRAGTFSAKFDASKLFYDEILEKSNNTNEINITLNKDEVIASIVEILSPKLCEYLLEVNQKELSIDEHSKLLAEKENLLDPKYTPEYSRGYRMGYSLANVSMFLGILLDIHPVENKDDVLIISLEQEAENLIRKKLSTKLKV